jgi:hypothetical protein
MPATANIISTTQTPAAPAFYEAAQAHFDKLVTKLQSKSAQDKTLHQLEDLVLTDGFEVLRLLLQSHVDERVATTTINTPVIGRDLKERTHQRLQTREVETLVGTITITRPGYGKNGIESLHPFDASLNLPLERYSHSVRRRAAETASKDSFDDLVAEINQNTGAHLPKRQAEQIVRRSAQDFEAFYRQREVKTEAGPASGQLLVITTDGKGVPMRKADLREETRKLAESRQPRLKHRRSKGEKPASKRMSTVAAVYNVEPFVRTPEQITGELRPSPQALPVERPRPEQKRVWASVKHPAEEVIRQAFEEATRRDPQHRKRWCALVDGNELQLGLLECAAEEYKVDLTIVLDLIHVTEYLWKATWALHSERDPAAEQWVSKHLLEILRGNSSLVAAGIRRSATRRDLTAKQRQPIDKCADYLLKYREYLRYDQYLAAGLPIATGVIEGACRYLVKDRMEKTGARWSLDGAEAVLRLRALKASGDLDHYWQFHLQQEYERQHKSHYADGKVPALVPLPNRSGKGSHLRLVKG